VCWVAELLTGFGSASLAVTLAPRLIGPETNGNIEMVAVTVAPLAIVPIAPVKLLLLRVQVPWLGVSGRGALENRRGAMPKKKNSTHQRVGGSR
jgi:hypothetical protein